MKHYTPEQVKFIKTWKDKGFPWGFVAEKFNEKYKVKVTENAVRFAAARKRKVGKTPKVENKGKKSDIPTTILVLPDLHFPFADWSGIEKAHAWAEKHKPDLVIQIGDLFDQKAWSRFEKDPDDLSPEDEWTQAFNDVERLHELFPKMHILSGNHDRRFYLKAAAASLPSKLVKSLKELFPFTGWTWHVDAKDRLIVPSARGDILFLHGDEMGGTPLSKATQLGVNLVQGHTHQASVNYAQTLNKYVFAAEAGHLMDVNSKGARYAARNPKGASAGFLILKHGCCYFIPNDGAPI
jgi:predicted phosphodiesterase